MDSQVSPQAEMGATNSQVSPQPDMGAMDSQVSPQPEMGATNSQVSPQPDMGAMDSQVSLSRDRSCPFPTATAEICRGRRTDSAAPHASNPSKNKPASPSFFTSTSPPTPHFTSFISPPVHHTSKPTVPVPTQQTRKHHRASASCSQSRKLPIKYSDMLKC